MARVRTGMEPDFYEPEPRSRRRRADTASLDLFGVEPTKHERQAPYQHASETSREAAGRIAPKAEGLRYEVLSAITDAGDDGCTRKEAEALTGMLTQTITPRLCELEQAGVIRKLTYLGDDRKIHTIKREGCSVYVLSRRHNDAA